MVEKEPIIDPLSFIELTNIDALYTGIQRSDTQDLQLDAIKLWKTLLYQEFMNDPLFSNSMFGMIETFGDIVSTYIEEGEKGELIDLLREIIDIIANDKKTVNEKIK